MDIHWVLLGGGPFFGCWGVLVDIIQLVVGGGVYVLAGGGWWWRMVVGGGLVQSNPFVIVLNAPLLKYLTSASVNYLLETSCLFTLCIMKTK